MRKLLQVDPSKRISAKQLLNSRWLREFASVEQETPLITSAIVDDSDHNSTQVHLDEMATSSADSSDNTELGVEAVEELDDDENKENISIATDEVEEELPPVVDVE